LSRPLLINLLAIGLIIGAFTSIPWFIGPNLPTLNRLLVQGIGLAFVAGWIVLLFRDAPAWAQGKVAWPFSSPFVVWAGMALLTAGHWLWLPFADEGVLLACMVCEFCTTTVYILATIQPPPSRGRIPIAPLILPLSMALYLVVFPNRFSLPLGVFALTYAFVVALMQRFWQQAVDEAHAARLMTEAALRQVAAERDAKTRFLESASHDLGQPLQAARLSFDQVMRARDPAARERAARRIGWAFDATEQLLRRMLEHLRLESGGVEARCEPVAVGPLIARVAEMNEPAARLAGVTIVAMQSRLVAEADPELTERILGNLVVNALRHAKASRVLVGVRPRGPRVRLWVIDDGVGIPAADAPRLFEDYVQGSNHGDEVRGGFGLGLASARRMAALMGAEVAHDASWRNGSAFWVELPRAAAKARG